MRVGRRDAACHMRNGASWAFAKIGGLGRFMVHDLTQGALKSLVLPAIFQADDEGSIPFTRSNVFMSSPDTSVTDRT
jgi:hypothetical protein